MSEPSITNPFNEMRLAVSRARSLDQAVRSCADDMAALLAGNLDKVSSWNLKKLKRELRNFNMHTGSWKE